MSVPCSPPVSHTHCDCTCAFSAVTLNLLVSVAFNYIPRSNPPKEAIKGAIYFQNQNLILSQQGCRVLTDSDKTDLREAEFCLFSLLTPAPCCPLLHGMGHHTQYCQPLAFKPLGSDSTKSQNWPNNDLSPCFSPAS